MTCREVFKYLEEWAPKEIAWQNDNVGLQVGHTNKKVKNILISLELTEEVLKYAVKKNCNLIITHHPLIFHQIKNLNLSANSNSKLIEQLIKHEITLYSAHTNLDFAKNGVSFQLAKVLGLKNISFLKNLESNQFKLIVFVPEKDLEKVAAAIFNAGGGIIGEYSNCSYRSKGEGTFKGSEVSNPAVGIKGVYEKVSEVKLEVLVDFWKINEVIKSMLLAHPYEEPAYDIYPLKNKNVNFGVGAIGNFEKLLTASELMNLVSKKLGNKQIKFVRGASRKIRKVAVCGGSGSDLLEEAINKNADALITADIKYHTFHTAFKKIWLIDAGHYETEKPILDILQKKLTELLQVNTNIKVIKFNGNTNPIKIYNKLRSHKN